MKLIRILACIVPVIMCSCQTHIIHSCPPVKTKPKVVVVKPKPKPRPVVKAVTPETFENVNGIR